MGCPGYAVGVRARCALAVRRSPRVVVAQWGQGFSRGEGGLGGSSSLGPPRGLSGLHLVAQQVVKGGGVLACSAPLIAC